MAAGTIGGRPGQRVCWADLRDSSCEDLMEASQDGPQLFDDSYRTQGSFDSQGLSNLLQSAKVDDTTIDTLDADASLSSKASEKQLGSSLLRRANAIDGIHVNDNVSNNGVQGMPVVSAPAAGAASPSRLNAHAPEFVPSFTQAAWASPASSGSAVMLPTVPERRRIVGKRRSSGGSSFGSFHVQTPTHKRPRGSDASEDSVSAARGPGDPEASEADWPRRNEKRRAAVANVKGTPEYAEVVATRARSDEDALQVPGTPDTEDRSISKRSWESQVMHWRTSVKRFAPDAD